MASTWHFLGKAVEADWLEAWGTWVGGLGTVGTLVYANIALRREADRRRDDVQSLRKAERDAQDAQARTVVLGSPTASSISAGAESFLQSYSLLIGNYGLHPVTDLTAILMISPSAPGEVFSSTPPSFRDLGVRNVASTWFPVLKPGEERPLKWMLTDLFIGHEGQEVTVVAKKYFEVEVRFTDVHGIRRVLRSGVGQQPSRLDDEIDQETRS